MASLLDRGHSGDVSAMPVCSSSNEGEAREGRGKSAAVGDVYFFYVGSCGNVDSVLGFALPPIARQPAPSVLENPPPPPFLTGD